MNLGLAESFANGLELAFNLGADIVVNTDGDHQYKGSDIKCLVKPILSNQADMVIGARQMDTITEFSAAKRFLQKFGSFIITQVAGTKVPDATSGFRAFNRRVGTALFVDRRFTYTLETIIQAARRNFRIISVPILVNPASRKSRLAKGTLNYVAKSIVDIAALVPAYAPLKFFGGLGLLSFSLGVILG